MGDAIKKLLNELEQLVDAATDNTLNASIDKLDSLLRELDYYAVEEKLSKESMVQLNLKKQDDLFVVSDGDINPEKSISANNKPQYITRNKDLLIGIDLGTSRSAVMSSRGDSFSFESVVGYAKDLIGHQLLKADYLVGDEVLNYSFLDCKYPLKDGVIKQESGFDYDSARKLIQHAVELVKPNKDEQVCAIIGVPANASKVNQKLLLKLARDYLDIAMVVSEPFMVAYGLQQLNNAIIVDIGAGTIDLCAMKGHLPEIKDQFSIAKAGNHIDALLMDLIEDSYPGLSLSKNYVRSIKEKHAFVGEHKTRVQLEIKKKGKGLLVDISDEIRYACESIVPDLIMQLRRLISGFHVKLQSRAIANIILSGGGSRIEGLDRMIINNLNGLGTVQVSCVQDIIYPGSAGALMLACELPPKYWGEFNVSFEND